MSAYVVDASVVAKLFFEEEHSGRSAALFRRASRLLAPDLVWAELGNVVWKRASRAEITDVQATLILGEAMRLPMDTEFPYNQSSRYSRLCLHLCSRCSRYIR